MPLTRRSPFQFLKRKELNAPNNTSIQIKNRLLLEGQLLQVQIDCLQEKKPPELVSIFDHYFKKLFKSQTDISLQWQVIDGGWRTQFTYVPTGVGSYLLRFSNGIHRQVNPYFRYFAVIDKATTICTLRHVVEDPNGHFHTTYHRSFVPADYEVSFSGANSETDAPAPDWVLYRLFHQKFGDHIRPWLNARDVQKMQPVALKTLLNDWQTVTGLPLPDGIGAQTVTPELVQAAIEADLDVLTGELSARVDVPAELNRKQAPIFPYFVNAAGKMPSQENTATIGLFPTTQHPLFAHDFSFYRANVAEACRAGFDLNHYIRSLQRMLNQSIMPHDPDNLNFMTIDFSQNSNATILQANRRVLRAIVRWARKDNVVFARKQDIVQLLRQQNKREYVLFMTDSFGTNAPDARAAAGLAQKSPLAHDVMYLENSDMRVCFRRSEMKPHFFYQFSQTVEKAATDFSDIQIDARIISAPMFKLAITVHSPAAMSAFPLGLWELPGPLAEIHAFRHNFDRLIPVNGNTRFFNSIALVSLQSGENQFYIEM